MEALDLSKIEINAEENDNKTSFSKHLRDLEKFEKKNGRGFDSFLARGAIYFNSKDFEKSKFYFEKAANIKYDINIISALMKLYSKTDCVSEIIPHLEKSRDILESNFTYWQLAGFAYAEMLQPEETANHLMKARQLGSKTDLTTNLLLKSLGKTNRRDEQYEIAKEEIAKNNLSKVIVESFVSSCVQTHRFEEVLNFFETTDYDWQSEAILVAFAGIAHQSNGNIEESLRLNKLALDIEPDNIEIRWNLALTQLRHGDLREGIENYKVRFDWKDFPSPKRQFDVPKWHEGVHKYSRILIWSEQGLADEILFSTALNSFAEEFPNLIFETHFKATEILTRSFPEIHCRTGLFDDHSLKPYYNDFEYHVPMGDIFLWFLNKNIEKLEAGETLKNLDYLKVDELRKQYWGFKLNKENNKPKVGFCWSSSILSDGRHTHHTELENWESVLSRKDIDFVSLQYDVDYEDISKNHSEISKYFMNTGFLDQMDDVDGALALMSNLDLVITSPSAPYALAGALGLETWFYSASSHFMLGRNGKFIEHPLLPNMKNYVTKSAYKDQKLIEDFNERLDSFVKNFKKQKV